MSTTARSVRLRRLAAAGVAALVFIAVYAATNLTAVGQTAENGLLRGWTEDQTLAYFLYHYVPIPPFKFEVPAIVGGVLLAALIAGLRRRWRDLATVVIAVPLAIAASQLFKTEIGRPILTDSPDFDPSYPSGHFLVAAVLTMALLTVVPRSWLRWCAPVLLGWTAIVASGVQAFGWHRPSDEIGSATLAAAAFLLMRVAVSGTMERIPFRPRIVVPTVLVVVVLATLAAVTPHVWTLPILTAFSLASTAIVAVVALRLIRDAEPVTSSPRVPAERELAPAGRTAG
jgi:hypothetical protein